ncbi:hypothetical protein [Roseobacter sp. OBYS 0001]|uniref:hypothetical protein n=1 Tax=Roseobacter sp. OBYS 0001 TaxID=882651 RepID=UPI001BC2BDCE|nr:hypothetical protein [Roseobacter sp. OBYS 0001]GIT85433.1 hypothetical protein ROBYS_04490 [Roseobacter sp. OBYS 0001]
MKRKHPADGRYQASGPFVIKRHEVRAHDGTETLVSDQRVICEIHKQAGDANAMAEKIAKALNTQARGDARVEEARNV